MIRVKWYSTPLCARNLTELFPKIVFEIMGNNISQRQSCKKIFGLIFAIRCIKLCNEVGFRTTANFGLVVIAFVPSFISPPDAVLQVCNILHVSREQLTSYRNERIFNLLGGCKDNISTSTSDLDLIIADRGANNILYYIELCVT